MIASETVSLLAVHSFDSTTGLYTLSLLKKGGPIITHTDLDEAKKEFSNALDLAMAVRNLIYFDTANKYISTERNNSKPSHNIEYRELTTAA